MPEPATLRAPADVWDESVPPPDEPWANPSEPVALPLPGIDLGALDAPLPDPDWLVPDRLIRRSLTVLGAKPGVGKSWVAQDLAVAVCTGRDWLQTPLPAPGRVLYVDAENGTELALERLQQLGATSRALAGRLHYTTASVTLPSTQGVARLKATIAAHQPDLVIIDTLASVSPTAEADTAGSSAFLAAVWHLARDHGAAVLILHHLRKGLQGVGRDDGLDSFRGAGHLIGAAHRAWLLEPLAPAEPKFILRDVKARRGSRAEAIRIEVLDDEIDGRRTTHLEVVGTVATVESGYDTFTADVLVYLGHKPGGTATTAELIHLPSAAVERTAKEHLARAKTVGILDQPRRGHWTRSGPHLDEEPTP